MNNSGYSPGILFVHHFPIDDNFNFALVFIDIIIRHREPAVTLFVKHLPDATTDSINHIVRYHCLAQAFIPVVTLWSLRFKSSLNSPGNERAAIRVNQFPIDFDEIYSLLHQVILMSNSIVQSFSNRVIIVLFHCFREQCTARQLSHCQISDLTKHIINLEYKWGIKMLVVLDRAVIFLKHPGYLCNSRAKFHS